jgi:NADH-quinone oxidoreductase subunit J
VSHNVVLAASAADTTRGIAFWLLAVISVAAGLGMVLARRAVHCAVLLAVVMLSLAVLYAMLGAPFLAFVQVIVYTGAVLMLFLFVMMIVGVTSADSIIETIRGQRLAAGLAGIGLLVLLTFIVGHAAIGPAARPGTADGSSNITGLATLIFTRYVFPFEVTSALLITAALGAMVLAHTERTGPKPTQRTLSRQRVASGRPAPLPGPGTYARHNAVDMPALLPDGSASRLSVSEVITQRAESASSALGPRAEVLTAGDATEIETGSTGRAGADPGNGTAGPAGADPGTGTADSKPKEAR